MFVSMSAADAFKVGAQIGVYGRLADVSAYRVTRHYGQLLQTRVKAKASGRPGPNAPTGEYRRSISLRMVRDKGSTIAVVGTNEPQGRRLEFGFVGIDSLGRHYNQPPYPHFGPALDEIGPQFIAAVNGMLGPIPGGS